MQPDDTLMEGLVAAALAAGEAILALVASGFSTTTKSDQSPVTEADARAEAIILARLADILPGVPVVAEEQAAAGVLPDDLGTRFVLVDPLDGTKEFVSGSGEYTVNIAVVENGRPAMGVVLAPALGQVWWGRVGTGAFTAAIDAATGRPDGARTIHVRAAPAEGLTVLASRAHCGPETEAYLRSVDVAERISAGSSLKFCRIAEGLADLYPRLARTMEWDTAAGEAVLVAAGGRVTTPDGGLFRYGKRGQDHDADFANGPFVARGGESRP